MECISRVEQDISLIHFAQSNILNENKIREQRIQQPKSYHAIFVLL